jgi:D-threo-aldose 1-dehydrogenase
VLSTKVGRVILDETEETAARDLGEKAACSNSAGRTRSSTTIRRTPHCARSRTASKRLGTDRLDIVWVHDIAQDFYGDEWLAQFEIARTGAFRVLTRLRDEGVIKAWGLGVNRVEPWS